MYLQCNETKIQALGNGILYCMLLNHFYPNSIPKNKIIMVPRNNMDNKTNLRKFQQTLLLLNIKTITFDIFRVSQMSYVDNWQLVSKIYRHFEQFEKNNQKQSQKVETNQSSNMHLLTNKTNMLNQPQQQSFILPKQIPKNMQFSSGLLTPMKGLKYFDENTKLRFQSLKLMEQIKNIVKSQSQSDKIKVKNLKKMLGLADQQNKQEQLELKQLFSDCKKKQQVITID